MRSLAQLQMAQDPSARAAMAEQFDLSDGADAEDEQTRLQEVSGCDAWCMTRVGRTVYICIYTYIHIYIYIYMHRMTVLHYVHCRAGQKCVPKTTGSRLKQCVQTVVHYVCRWTGQRCVCV